MWNFLYFFLDNECFWFHRTVWNFAPLWSPAKSAGRLTHGDLVIEIWARSGRGWLLQVPCIPGGLKDRIDQRRGVVRGVPRHIIAAVGVRREPQGIRVEPVVAVEICQRRRNMSGIIGHVRSYGYEREKGVALTCQPGIFDIAVGAGGYRAEQQNTDERRPAYHDGHSVDAGRKKRS